MRNSVFRLLLAFCLVFLAASISFSEPIDMDAARAVGLAHINAQRESGRHRPSLSPPKLSISGVRALRDSSGRELAYIVDLSPGGFVAVSADTDIHPVIAYSFNGEFSMENSGQNTPLHIIRQDMTNRLEALPLTPEYVRSENNFLWEQYLGVNAALLAENTEQWPPGKDIGWLDTTWAQNAPYNSSCPDDPNTTPGKRYDNGEYTGGAENGRCLTGCTATAIGQILNYWQHPPAILFTSSDNYTSSYDPDDGFGERVIQITASEASMSSIDYNDGDPSESTIADLLFACGVALKTKYSDTASSSAINTEVYNRLEYASAVRIPGDDVSFYGILKDNMKNAQPAQLSIAKYDGDTLLYGHSVVADGYRVNDAGEYYHLNFGWGDSIPDPISECWYSLPDMMPNEYNVVDLGIMNISPSLGPSRDWYVSPAGNDGNDGKSWESAKRNIQSAINACQSGDVIRVAAGVYLESIKFRDGATILGDGAETTRIEYNGDYPVVYSDRVQDAEISGFTIEYAGTAKNPAIFLANSSITISNNIIKGAIISGIIISDHSNPRITGNEIRDSGQSGIYVYLESSGTISGNVISDNEYNGISVRDNSEPQIIYNTIAFNKNDGIWVYLDAAPVISNNIIVNNKLYGIDADGYTFGNNGSPVLSFNNVWGNKPRNYSRVAKPATDISVDPLFVDSANDDYHLQQDSPCRGASENGSDLGAYSSQTTSVRTLSISSVVVYPEDMITVWINIDDTRDLASGKIVVKYDPDVIAVGEITSLLPDMLVAVNKDISGEIHLALASGEGMPAGSCALASIELTANADAQVGAETVMSFDEAEIYDEAGADIPVATDDGTVTIAGRKGDLNKDGGILPDDAIMTLQIIVLLLEPTAYQKWAADVNNNGGVGPDDAILILRETLVSSAPGAICASDGTTKVAFQRGRESGSGRVTVPLKLDNAGGLAGGVICIEYNSAALRPFDVSSESKVLIASNTTEPGMLRIAFAGVNGAYAQTVIDMQFDILGHDDPGLEIGSIQLYRSDASIIDAKLVDYQLSYLSFSPERYALLQNFPNPFNPETWIPYQLPQGTDVAIRIYAATGQLVRTLNLGEKSAGFYTSRATAAHWDGRNETGEPVASGVYFVVLKTGEYQYVRRIVLLK